MWVTNVNERDAVQQRQVVLHAMRAADMRAYAVEGVDLLGGLVDFPLPTTGPSFVWVGYWKTANARRVGTTPALLIGTSLKAERGDLHRRLRLASGEAERFSSRTVALETMHGTQERPLLVAGAGRAFADFEDGDTAVTLVATDLAELPARLKIVRWTDKTKLIDEWTSLFD